MSIMLTLNKACFISIIALTVPNLCIADILVYKNHYNNTIELIEALPALFGPIIPSEGFKGYVVHASPSDGCTPPVRPPISDNKGPYFALVRRYNCTFVTKALNAQYSGYEAIIVRNVGSNSVQIMNGDQDHDDVHIPAVFIGEDDGLMIQHDFQYNSGYYVVLVDDAPFNIQNYLLPFAITIGICFVLMLTFMLVKCIRDYRKSRRHRLSSRALKKLPIHKFKKGDPYECCAVCLDDYADNDKLRILPCSHAYHSKCIDPWLTKNRRVCPVCKRKVIIGNEQPSDIDTESEDEAAPLINTVSGSPGGTFAIQRENPFQEAQREAERRRSNRRTQPRYHNLEDSSSDDEQFHEPINPAKRRFGHEEDSQDESVEVRRELPGTASQSNQVHIEDPSQRPSQSDTKDCII